MFLPNYHDTQRLGCLLGEHLNAGITILLTGNLGAGKTTLVQGIGRGLGIKEPITSPTFTLINEYLDGRLPLYHLDLYRLKSERVDEIYPEMYWSGIEVTPGITAIEWSQRLPFLPPSYLKIELANCSDGRKVEIMPHQIAPEDLKFIESFTLNVQ
jgi:tRNA threonylcarbamoyladenosine biosynthesis protein TsaE